MEQCPVVQCPAFAVLSGSGVASLGLKPPHRRAAPEGESPSRGWGVKQPESQPWWQCQLLSPTEMRVKASAPLTWLTEQKPPGAEKSPWPRGANPAVPAILLRPEGLTREGPRVPTPNPRRRELEPWPVAPQSCTAGGCARHQAPRARPAQEAEIDITHLWVCRAGEVGAGAFYAPAGLTFPAPSHHLLGQSHDRYTHSSSWHHRITGPTWLLAPGRPFHTLCWAAPPFRQAAGSA